MQAQKGLSTKTIKVGSSGFRLIQTCMWIRKALERVKPRPLGKHSRGIYHTKKEQRVAQILS